MLLLFYERDDLSVIDFLLFMKMIKVFLFGGDF